MQFGITYLKPEQEGCVPRKSLILTKTMKALLAASLVILPALIGGGEAKAFSYYNPYKSSYNQWNNSFSGYDGGHSSYRKQIRSMNPYRSGYRSYNNWLSY